MKTKILSASLLMLSFLCHSQENHLKNNITLGLGASHIARQDLIFSPLVHSDFSLLNFSLNYSREANFYQKIALRYSSFNPIVGNQYNFSIHGENHTANPHSFNFVDLDYVLAKNLIKTEKSTFSVGAYLGIDVQAMNYSYGRISSFGYYSSLGLGLAVRHNLELTKRSNLTTQVQVPVVAWLARSPFLVNDDQFIENIYSHSGIKTFSAFLKDGNLVSVNTLQSIDFSLSYSYAINSRLKLGTEYLFEFIHSQKPRSLYSYNNSFKLHATFSF